MKIDVMDFLLKGHERFTQGKTLVVTGERAQESKARAGYEVFEPHRSDLRDGKRYKRHIDHWRPVHKWTEERVWETMERYRINPAYAYQLGWSRLSCMICIFADNAQLASMQYVAPDRIKWMSDHEQKVQCSIHRTKYITERLKEAKPYVDMDPVTIEKALSRNYNDPIFIDDWELPRGAYGESAGPS